MIDVDHFKRVNDTCGHQAGDDVLRELGKRCLNAVRPYDIVGRYGGEEFLVIFPGAAQGIALSERLRKAVCERPFSTRAGQLDITVSLGVTVANGSWDADSILASADAALYQAKESGRNKSCQFQKPCCSNFRHAPKGAARGLEATAQTTEPNKTAQALASSELPRNTLRLLLVDDAPDSLHFLTNLLKDEYLLQIATNGSDALEIVQSTVPPDMILLDWMMPQMDGLEVCQRIRSQQSNQTPHIIMLTARDAKTDIVTALRAGADDYLTKPFDASELCARLNVAGRLINTRKSLATRVDELQHALEEIKTLRGIIPICSFCKSIRNDQGYWDKVETYIHAHSEAEFSHGICPECMQKHYPEVYEEMNEPNK